MKENFHFEKSKWRERLVRFEFSERILQLYGNKTRENRVKIIYYRLKERNMLNMLNFSRKNEREFSFRKKQMARTTRSI